MKTVTVKSGLPKRDDGGFPLALFERNEAHKGGEIYIADDETHEVALTAEVKAALNDGRLVEAEEGESEKPDTPYADADDTVDSLKNRYNTVELEDLAGKYGVEVQDEWQKKDIAEAILDARDAGVTPKE